MDETGDSSVPRLVLADDHAGLLAEIRSLLEPEFRVVSSTADGTSLLHAVREYLPDAVVADVEMPGTNGIDAARKIVGSGLCDAVVILTIYDDPDLIAKAAAAGVRGYVLKVDAGEELIPALRAVLAGGRYLSHGAGAGRGYRD